MYEERARCVRGVNGGLTVQGAGIEAPQQLSPRWILAEPAPGDDHHQALCHLIPLYTKSCLIINVHQMLMDLKGE